MHTATKTPKATALKTRTHTTEGTTAHAPAVPETMREKFVRLRPAALALADADVEAFQADPIIVRNNVRLAVENLAPHRAKLEAMMPTTDWTNAFSALDLAEALLAAEEPAPVSTVSVAQINAARDELQALRVPALLIGRGLALLGHLPLAEVERIEAGVGLIDMGRDGIDLAVLFREHAARVASMHPFTVAQLARMEALGEWLIRNVTPRGARTSSSPDGTIGMRDRFWTLVQRAHATLRKGAFVVHGEAYGTHVPALRSYAVTNRGTSVAPPAESPPDAPATVPDAPATPTP